MSRVIKAGTTDVSVVIRIIDSTDGTPETGVVWNTAGIDMQYRREGAASTAITEATLAALTTAHTDGGFLHIGNGYYRLDLPDAAVAAGATGVLVHGTVTGMVVIGEYIQLVAYDPFDAVRMGMTALPNAAADAAGGLPISDAGGLDLDGLNTNVNSILTDTGTTLDNHLTDIKGTAFVKDTHSLVNIEGYADLIDDGTSGLAKIATDVAAILVDTGTTLDTKLNDIQGATFSSATDSLEAIRDRGDAAWTTGAGGSDRLLMVDTTIATLTSQTQFTLTAGSADDNAYRGCTIVIEDVSTSTQKAIGIVDTYTGSTKTVNLLEDPGVFTMATTDKVYILAEKGLKPTTANDYHVDVNSTGTVGIDWGNVDNPTTAVDLSATDIQLVDTVTTYTGNTVQTGDAFARLGAPAGASVSADVAAVKVDTAAILVDTAEIGAAGAGLTEAGGTGDHLTAIPWNAAWDAEVQSEVDDALVAQKLDHLVAVADADDVVDNSIIAKLANSGATADWSLYVNTTDSLMAIRDHIGDGTNLTEAGGTGDQLTAINLPDQTMNITGDITGNLSGSVGSVTGAVGSVTGAVGSVTAGVTIAAGGIGSGAIASAELNTIADAILDRNMGTGTDSGSASVRTVRQALRASRNKVAISGGTATVFKEDDVTSSWTAAVSTTAGDPISAVDPTGP